jgi:hypothetical protein
VTGTGVWVAGGGENSEEDLCEETGGDDIWVLPLGLVEEVEDARARMLDFVGVRGRGDVVTSRRVDAEPFAKPLEESDGFERATLDPFRIPGLVVDTAFRCIEENLSRSGDALCGGVDGRDRDEGGGDSGYVSRDGLVVDEGGTVMEIKVSTKRDLMTFSSPF